MAETQSIAPIGTDVSESGSSLVISRDPRFVGTGFFAGEAPDGLTTVYGDPIPADVFVYWRDHDSPLEKEVLVGATKSAQDGTWRIMGLNYNLQYVIRARAQGYDDATVVGARPSRSDVIAYVNHLEPTEYFDGLIGHVLLDSGLPPFTCEVIGPLPYGLEPVLDGRKLLIEGASTDKGLWDSVVRVTASNAVWVDVPVQVQIQVLRDPHWDNVVSLLHFDGSFTDETGRIWTAQGVELGPDGRFGGSLVRDISGSSLYTPGAADFRWDAQSFTMECWAKAPLASYTPNSPGRSDMLCRTGNGVEIFDWGFGINERNRLSFAYWGGAAYIVESTDAFEAGGWHHIAMTFDGAIIRLFLDGDLVASDAKKGSPTHSAAPIRIGAGLVFSSHKFALDAVRVTNGVARYTANFNPPTRPFPNQ